MQVRGSNRKRIASHASTLTSGLRPWIIVHLMKLQFSLAFALLASVILIASANSRAPVSDPIEAFSSIETGADLLVKRSVTRLDVGARGAVEPIFSLTGDGVARLRTNLSRPPQGAPAAVREVRGAKGELVWHVAHTARGARVLVAEPGVLHPKGLHVLLFDNDDLHVTTGDGALLYARRTLADGTLHEQEGIDGCDCARSTSAAGVVTVEVR